MLHIYPVSMSRETRQDIARQFPGETILAIEFLQKYATCSIKLPLRETGMVALINRKVTYPYVVITFPRETSAQTALWSALAHLSRFDIRTSEGGRRLWATACEVESSGCACIWHRYLQRNPGVRVERFPTADSRRNVRLAAIPDKHLHLHDVS